MSVVVRMEMPRTCEDCNLESFCDLWVEARRMSNGNRAKLRHPDCPLIEVPEPHGRLGDLDALAQQIEHDRFHHAHTDCLSARYHIAEYGHFLMAISGAPTVIPAEEDKRERIF